MKKILIVGGGIAGLSLACFLRESDFECKIIEKRDENIPEGYGINLWGNGVGLIKQLGIYKDVYAHSRDARWLRICNDSGREIKRISFDDFSDSGVVGIYSRNAILRALRTKCPCPILYRTTIQTVEKKGSGYQVTLSDQTSDIYDYIIGADGTHSFVRDQFFEGTKKYSGWSYRIWKLDPTLYQESGTTYISCRKNIYCLFPMNDMLFFAHFQKTKDGSIDASVYEHFSRLCRDTKVDASEVQKHLLQGCKTERRLYTYSGDRYINGGVVLLGDAAHSISPTTGFGGSMAMEDSHLLAKYLMQGMSISDYERSRAKRVSGIVRYTNLVNSIILIESLWSKIYREFLCKVAPIEIINSLTRKAISGYPEAFEKR